MGDQGWTDPLWLRLVSGRCVQHHAWLLFVRGGLVATSEGVCGGGKMAGFTSWLRFTVAILTNTNWMLFTLRRMTHVFTDAVLITTDQLVDVDCRNVAG